MDQATLNILEFMIMIGFIPIGTMFIQFLFSGLNRFYNHYDKCRPCLLNVSVVLPAWNESDVIRDTIEVLFRSNYDHKKLRIYLVDDASTDNTPQVANDLASKYPDSFFYLRREQGGQGKANALNYGLEKILLDDWAQAVLIIDADVIFETNTLNRMLRHLADPKIGCVTCYIKESTRPGTYVNRYIAYEYILSEMVARRAQNVLGALACVAGGAQLHSRANIEALGGKINTSTMAEDTYTTFMTQILGRKTIFEGNATVKAEEPSTITTLWKQRKRWSRGNFQITRSFKQVWFRFYNPSGLGGILFGLIWFSIELLPFIMISTSIGLFLLYYLDPYRAWILLKPLAGLSIFIYIYMTIYSYFVDPGTFRHSWMAAITFPGVISFLCMVVLFAPHLFAFVFKFLLGAKIYHYCQKFFIFFVCFWVSGCMIFAWLTYKLDRMGFSKTVVNTLLIITGYGPILCAITLSAFISEVTKRETKWDKTEKTGRVPIDKTAPIMPYNFYADLKQNQAVENKLLCVEVVLFIVLIALFIQRNYFGF